MLSDKFEFWDRILKILHIVAYKAFLSILIFFKTGIAGFPRKEKQLHKRLKSERGNYEALEQVITVHIDTTH